MKLVVIGGSAFSTPELIRFLNSNERSGRMQVVLASRSMAKLQAVERASMLAGSGAVQLQIEAICQDSWRRVLPGAHCVLIQIRVGGYEGRSFDESFPHKYRLCGDEGLGPGGLSAGWRTWPVIADLLEAISSFCPGAFVILMTSPLSLLVRASHKFARLKLVGVCELPWTTLQELSAKLGLPSGNLQADYLGVNHLGWFFNFHCGSDSLQEEVACAMHADSFPSRDFVQVHGCFPTRYLRMHYQREQVLSEQVSQPTSRGATLSKLQEQAGMAFATGSAAAVAEILSARRAPWYPHAVGPLILALGGEASAIPFFLSVRNGPFTELLGPDDVIECRHHWVDGELVRPQLGAAPPPHLASTLRSFVRFEQVAAEAIRTRSGALLLEALSVHPWTQGHPQIRALASEIVCYDAGGPAAGRGGVA